MNNKQPTFFKVVQVDYPSVIAVSFPMMIWIFFAFFFVLGLLLGLPVDGMLFKASLVSYLFFGAIILSLICAPILPRRYRTITRIFDGGQEVEGVIRGIGFFRDRGAIEVSYPFNGEKLICRNAVQKMDRTQSLKIGQTVVMVVDQENPTRAFIKDLFI